MAIFEWRKFNFFDLKSNADAGNVSSALLDAEISCAASGNNQVILCDSAGNVHIFGRTWSATSFRAHEGPVLLCKMANSRSVDASSNLLITVGTDDSGQVPDLKVWSLSGGKQSKGGLPACVRTMKIALQKPTALGVSDGGQYMAIGFDRGSISLYRGDIARDRSKTMKSLSGGSAAITGIAFRTVSKIAQMFICSDSGVILYNLHSRDKEIKVVLDSMPAPIRCCVLQTGHSSGEAHFMVGKDDAVYCYTSEDRASCYALDGQKSILQWFRSNLLTVSKPTKSSMSSQKDSVLTVIDIQNKFIVFTTTIDAVAAILVEFGTCYVITKAKEVFHLDEKDLQSKLNLLFKKNLYDIAVRIAKSNQYDSEGLAEIFRQYGDHLYGKGDYPGSVEQYVRTIGYLEPSYVIRKFLDSRHIHCLTDYLQQLHQLGHATADHTTLLLNCFTRLDQTTNLREFLSNDANPDLIFDLDVAIKVCRTASVEHALSLAKRNRKHDFAISILTEDMEAFTEALEYISHLSFDDADKSLKKYGYLLMAQCPMEMTALLKKLCTDYNSVQNRRDDQLMDSHWQIDRGSPEDFIHLFGQDTALLVEFLEHLVANVSNCSCLVFNTLIESYLTMWRSNAGAEARLMEILQKFQDSYDRNHIVILCRLHEFWPGVMLIYEEEQLYHLIVRHHLKNRDYNSLLDTCRRLGSLQSSLWLQALTGLRSDKTAPSNLLSQILHVIAQEKLQSPLQVLNCLAVENGPNLSSVREYFMQVFQKECDSFRQEDQLVEKYRRDSVVLKKHIKSLQEDPIEFRGTICNNCHQPLSIPAIYFLCQHSYHLDCVKGYSENDKDCPACHTKNMQILDSLKAQSESRGQHDAFHNLLDRSAEPFSIVADYFGRGLFNKIVIVEENTNVEGNKATIRGFSGAAKLAEAKMKASAAPAPSYSSYGTGAEARMRVQEVQASGKVDIPVAEGRMRVQERQKHRDNVYSSSLEANMTWGGKKDSARTPPVGSPRRTANTISKNLAPNAKPNNPFEDEIQYDDSKNPFADDDDEDEAPAMGKEASTNPFDDYDSNLNPFE
ncbi:vacuolar protein sorting-associated protein 11 homolog [Phlebotomus argentipes]|uniref:vacuolar protein sorting-associated protein 11 homolog n=1 Tax=Phlebotomus argentipes TaxID=94469 RepID=UPI0028933883|nr:vacuolar protein sorting-associated protein 11 homolog [Phlebotomus argentipes]